LQTRRRISCRAQADRDCKDYRKTEEELWKKRISPELDYLEAKKSFDEANIELHSAEQKLHAFGFLMSI